MYSINNFLDQCYESKNLMNKNLILKKQYYKIKEYIKLIEKDLYGLKLSNVLTKEIIAEKIHFVYMINLLYLGCLYTKGLTPKEAYIKTLFKLDNSIERKFTINLISEEYMRKLTDDEINKIEYYYSLLTL